MAKGVGCVETGTLMGKSTSPSIWRRAAIQAKRWLPLLCIASIALVAYRYHLPDYLSLQTIREQRDSLLRFVDNYPVGAPCLYTLAYALLAAASLPGGALLTILGGFLFAQPMGTIYVVIGASLGASCLFLSVRHAFFAPLKKRMSPRLCKLAEGYKKHPVSYLLFLRLVPLFPFWLVNIAPALLGVAFVPFFWTTVVGIIPGSFVYVQAGVGLGKIFDTGAKWQDLFNPEIRLFLFFLGLASLAPIVFRRAYPS